MEEEFIRRVIEDVKKINVLKFWFLWNIIINVIKIWDIVIKIL